MSDGGKAIVHDLRIGAGPASIVIKDSIDVAGAPTRQGSAVLADVAPAARHAWVVERLLADGGWTIVGKANMHEFAFGVTGVNPWSGTPVNPLWPDLIPGGSSSGSAVAVAAGLVDAALGADTGGSIRMPAACCGVVGFKPTFGLVSREGVHPAKSSLDCVGPFARSVEMIERVMTALTPGWSPVAAPAIPKIGLVRLACADEIAEAVQDAVARLDAAFTPCQLPMMERAFDAGLVLIGVESWAALGALADHPAMGEDVRARLKAGGAHSGMDVLWADAVRVGFIEEVDRLLKTLDVLMLPTLPEAPPTLAEAGDARRCVPLTRLVRPFNLSGHPAITLPLTTRAGRPAGLQIVGRRGQDARLCAIARWAEQRLGQPH